MIFLYYKDKVTLMIFMLSVRVQQLIPYLSNPMYDLAPSANEKDSFTAQIWKQALLLYIRSSLTYIGGMVYIDHRVAI